MAKIGRPTNYKPEYCQQILDFFSVDRFLLDKKTFTTKNGTVIEEPIKLANELPTLEMFAHKLETHTGTIVEWTKRFPDFKSAYMRAKDLQKNFLIQNGMAGLANPIFTKFVAINITDMRDQLAVEHSGKLEDVLGSLKAKRERKSK